MTVAFAADLASKNLVFSAEDPFHVRSLIPQSRLVDHDQYNIAVKHTLDNVRVLRNVGYEAPIPNYNYRGKFTPKSHQEVMVDFYATHQKGFNLSDMGAMKTAATLWAADLLMEQGVIERAIIFAPLSTLETVWMQELFDNLMHRRGVVVHGSREKRAKALALDVDFYVTNHDAVCTDEVFTAVRDRKDIGLIVVDEGSKFRNPGTDKFKRLGKIIGPHHWVWWLTGAPCPNAPTDAWAQAKIINPGGIPKFIGTFRTDTMVQLSKYKWVSRQGAERVAQEALRPAVRFRKADCIQLPPVVTINCKTELSTEQKKLLAQMKANMQAQIRGHTIDAVNAADQINKMRQLLCGAVYDSTTDSYVPIDHKERTETLIDLIDSASSKALVIVPFKGIIQDLGVILRKRYSVGMVNGDVSINQRNKIFRAFKTNPDPHVLLCHPTVMAHGLNLTEADTLIFYAPIYSNDEYGQVIERFNRAGQKLKMTIARIGAHPIEWAIYRMIDFRKDVQETIMDLYNLAVTE